MNPFYGLDLGFHPEISKVSTGPVDLAIYLF